MRCKAVKFVFLLFASFLILTAGVSCARAVGHDEGALIEFVNQNLSQSNALGMLKVTAVSYTHLTLPTKRIV